VLKGIQQLNHTPPGAMVEEGKAIARHVVVEYEEGSISTWQSSSVGIASEPGGKDVNLTSLSESAPNKAVEPTPYSVRCAPASGRGSPLAFGA
jgi:hypothetical protein